MNILSAINDNYSAGASPSKSGGGLLDIFKNIAGGVAGGVKAGANALTQDKGLQAIVAQLGGNLTKTDPNSISGAIGMTLSDVLKNQILSDYMTKFNQNIQAGKFELPEMAGTERAAISMQDAIPAISAGLQVGQGQTNLLDLISNVMYKQSLGGLAEAQTEQAKQKSIPAPLTEKVGDSLFQYNPTDNSWAKVAEGQASVSGLQKTEFNVEGKDYVGFYNPTTGKYEGIKEAAGKEKTDKTKDPFITDIGELNAVGALAYEMFVPYANEEVKKLASSGLFNLKPADIFAGLSTDKRKIWNDLREKLSKAKQEDVQGILEEINAKLTTGGESNIKIKRDAAGNFVIE